MSVRLTLAREAGFLVPDQGSIAVFAPTPGFDLSAFPVERLHVIQPFRPHLDHFARLGIPAGPAPDGRYGAAIVCAPRAKARAQALIWQAAQVTDGPVAVDGAKSDGIDSLLKAMRARVPVHGPVSKAHGRTFWFMADPAAVSDWQPGFRTLPGGWVTWPGVFSADAADQASVLLAGALPDVIGRRVVDLGAGWGYLAARLLERDTIERLDLVEADCTALECARRNVPDPRAVFHWADARDWQMQAKADAVVMNPPFHTGRTPEPELGRAFVATAARLLAPQGVLWMVANRHLPYETALSAHFRETEELAGDNRFKLLRAARPSRPRR